MRKIIALSAIAASCLLGQYSRAQNIEGQIVASQFGTFQVPGIASGSLNFEPATCQVTGGGKNFVAFTAQVPLKIVDSNPALNEIDTPVAAYPNQCTVSMTTTHLHNTPFYVTSGTGGLQEALINGPGKTGGPNTVILNSDWYQQVQPGNPATVIAAVKGNTSLGLVDVTTTPYTYYDWNGTNYVAIANGGGAVLPSTGIVFANNPSTGATASSAQIVAGINTSPSTQIASAALPIGSSSVLGVVKSDGTTTSISSGGVISANNQSGTANQIVATPNGSSGLASPRAMVPADMPVATNTTFGAVKPDNSTITVSGGVISSVGGGGGTPGGTNTQVQYNNFGAFAGDSTFLFNNSTKLLSFQNGTLTALGTATSSANFNSGILKLCDSYYDGSNPQPGCWTFQTTPLSGTNPFDILTVGYNGSPTGGQINMPFTRYLSGFELQADNGSGFIQFKGPPNMPNPSYSIHWPADAPAGSNTFLSCTPTDSINCTASWAAGGGGSGATVITPQQFGGFGDAYNQPDGCTATASNTTITCRDDTFVSGDVGKQFWLQGAGAAGVAYHGTIVSVTDNADVVVTPAPSTSVGYGVLNSVYGHDDTAAVNSCMQASADNGVQCVLPALPPPGGGNTGYTGFLIGSGGLILPANYLGLSANVSGSNYVTNLFCEFDGDCLSLGTGAITSALVSNLAMLGDPTQPDARAIHLNATGGLFGNGGLWNSTFSNILVNGFAQECLWMDGGGGPGYTFNLPNQIDTFSQFQCDGPNQPHPANLILGTGQAAQILFINGQVNGFGTSNYPNYLISFHDQSPTEGVAPVDVKFYGYTYEVGTKGLFAGTGTNNIHFDNGYVEVVADQVFTLLNSPGFTFNGNHIASSGSGTAVGNLTGNSTASMRDNFIYGVASAALAVCTGSNNTVDFAANDTLNGSPTTTNCATTTGASAGGAITIPTAFSTVSITEPDSDAIITLSAPMVAPGKTLTLYAGGVFQLATGGNISLGSYPSPLNVPAGGSVVLTLLDSGVTWIVTSANGVAPAVASSETVGSGPFPVFSTAFSTSYIALAGNVAGPVLAAGADGQHKTLCFKQGAGPYTVASPTNVHGFFTVGTTNGGYNCQSFVYNAANSIWLAESPGVINQ